MVRQRAEDGQRAHGLALVLVCLMRFASSHIGEVAALHLPDMHLSACRGLLVIQRGKCGWIAIPAESSGVRLTPTLPATARRDLFVMADGITNRRAVGYARSSSEMQKDGWTIQAQTKTIIDHLEGEGARASC